MKVSKLKELLAQAADEDEICFELLSVCDPNDTLMAGLVTLTVTPKPAFKHQFMTFYIGNEADQFETFEIPSFERKLL